MSAPLPIATEVWPPGDAQGLRLTIPVAALVALAMRPHATLSLDVPGIGLVQIRGDAHFQSLCPMVADVDAHGNPVSRGVLGAGCYDLRGLIFDHPTYARSLAVAPVVEALVTMAAACGRAR